MFPGTFTSDGRKVSIKECKWKTEATREQSMIDYWQQNFSHKIKFWGVPTGAENGLLVLDVDIKDDGHKTIKNYIVPLTMTQQTISGGVHHIFKYPLDGNNYGNRVKFDVGLDIRGEGGYIAHYGFDTTPIADAPYWLLEQALNNKEETVINVEDIVTISPVIAQEIIESACENVRNAPEGESNNVLNIEAYRVGQLLPSNSVDPTAAYNALFNAAKERGKPDYEAKATIESGFEGGKKHPLTCPFGNIEPVVTVPVIEPEESPRWTPKFFSRYDLTNMSKLKKPQLFKDWSTEDIHITTADGGTGKTTLKLCEAISLALGESFLGFECIAPGRTLFITGEDTAEKLGAMLGAILTQMGLLDGKPENEKKVKTVLNSVLVKKASDLCLIAKTKQGFIEINHEALNKVTEAVEDIRPKMIVFDPISSFWGSESALNDMSKAVATFMGALVERSNACVEVINHMGKASSTNKDMGQFAGRGGSALPSHARVSRVLRPLLEDEYEELTGGALEEDTTAMMCNVNKFSDGSPLFNNPFLITRKGYLFSKVELLEQKVKEERTKMSDNERVFTYVKDERSSKRYPSKDIIIARFISDMEKISKERINRAIHLLAYTGHLGEKFKAIENPDIEAGGKVYIITDKNGVEV